MGSEALEFKISFALWLVLSGLVTNFGLQASNHIRERSLTVWAEAVSDHLTEAASLAKEFKLRIPFTFSSPIRGISTEIRLDGTIIEIRIGDSAWQFSSEVSFSPVSLIPGKEYTIEYNGSEANVRWRYY